MTPELAAIVARNGGVFTRRDALRSGYPRCDIDALLRCELWQPLRRGIYVDTLLLDVATPAGRHALDVAAARLAVPTAVGSHESAALVRGMTLWPEAVPLRVTLTRPGRPKLSDSRLGPSLLMYGAEVPAEHRVTAYGVEVTSPARTIVDLTLTRPLLSACVTAEAALHAGLVTTEELSAAVATFDNPPAGVRMHEIAGPESESVLETISWVRFHEAGIELPERQRVIYDHEGVIGRADFFWKRQGLVGEADGLAKYRGDDTALIREKLRQERMERAGHPVVRWGWRDMVDRPAETIARIVRALQRAA